jgi:hypothetical protein
MAPCTRPAAWIAASPGTSREADLEALARLFSR